MKLILSREDLRPEHVSINCSLTRFEHFNGEAQAAIMIVVRAGGRATFYEYDRSSYNAIYPAQPEAEPRFWDAGDTMAHFAWTLDD